MGDPFSFIILSCLRVCRYARVDRPQHWELHAVLFTNSVRVPLLTLKICDTETTVYRTLSESKHLHMSL